MDTLSFTFNEIYISQSKTLVKKIKHLNYRKCTLQILKKLLYNILYKSIISSYNIVRKLIILYVKLYNFISSILNFI